MDLRAMLRADFAANRRRIDRLSVLAFRLNQAATSRLLLKPVAKLLNLLWLEIIVGAELPGEVRCGPGLRVPHAARGVILHPNVTLGSGVTLYHRVTVGVSGGDRTNVPSIGDGVYLGTGATLFGRLHVGDGARIGAGAVVTKDVPPGATAVGVPAKVLKG